MECKKYFHLSINTFQFIPIAKLVDYKIKSLWLSGEKDKINMFFKSR